MPRLIPHEVIRVYSIPDCEFCQMQGVPNVPGPYDFPTVMGPWASGCEEHWKQYRVSATLGIGKGQLWITADQVEEG